MRFPCPEGGGWPSEARPGGAVMQRLIDEGQHAFQIAIDLIVPETQYPETFADQMIVAAYAGSFVRAGCERFRLP